jgi:hypothetical protein
VGFSEKDAQELAFFSQLPDEVSGLDAVQTEARDRNSISKEKHQANVEVQVGNHALSGLAGGLETAQTLDAIKAAKGNAETGLLIHRLGDTHAHRVPQEDSGGDSRSYDTPLFDQGLGHGGQGTAPDAIQRRPELYLEYTRTLTRALAEKRGLDSKEIGELEKSISSELQSVATAGVGSGEKLDASYNVFLDKTVFRGRGLKRDRSLQQAAIDQLKRKLGDVGFINFNEAHRGLPQTRLNANDWDKILHQPDLNYRPEEFGPESLVKFEDAYTVDRAVKDQLEKTKVADGGSASYSGQEIVEALGRIRARIFDPQTHPNLAKKFDKPLNTRILTESPSGSGAVAVPDDSCRPPYVCEPIPAPLYFVQ